MKNILKTYGSETSAEDSRSNPDARSVICGIVVLCLVFLGACSDEGDGKGGTPEIEPAAETCVEGSLDCECGEAGACGSSPEGLPLQCNADGVCELVVCTPGSLYCQCAEGGGCDNGAECRDGLCVMPDSLLLSVNGEDARACDIVLSTSGKSVRKVTYTDGAMGSEFARGGKLSISLIRRADSPFVEAPAVIDLGDSMSPSDIEVESVQCYDSKTAPIAETVVTLQ